MTRLPLPLLVACGLALALAGPATRRAVGQSPMPTAFMRDVVPTSPEPSDGADVLVVEGLGSGLGGCAFSLSLIEYVTVLAINDNRRTVTEITPQDWCDPNINNWKSLVQELVDFVESHAPNAGTYWAGVMLDEEDGFWESAPGSAAVFQELNAFVQDVMIATPGISYYFTETFSSQGAWDGPTFAAVTRNSVPAPQVATNYMVSLTNYLQSLTGAKILVTWSQAYPTGFKTLAGASGKIQGPPYRLWGLDLSNCFTTGAEVCGPDSDHDGLVDDVETGTGIYVSELNTGSNRLNADSDGDGYTDGQEVAMGKNPNVFCQTMRADVNGDGLANSLDLALVAQYFSQRIPPAPARFDQAPFDGRVNLLDLAKIALVFGRAVTSCP